MKPVHALMVALTSVALCAPGSPRPNDRPGKPRQWSTPYSGGACSDLGTACAVGGECCTGLCSEETDTCCQNTGSCTENAECCSGSCGEGSCVAP